ncbi:hypothetical protein WN944_024391 [Citrus x changshan-huyou]|uniref:Uncharacterized protein n=1 Tax=Citrus x changshan-huyou TaxID=2935761 RepID=A0AAP0LMX7_9ROSI
MDIDVDQNAAGIVWVMSSERRSHGGWKSVSRARSGWDCLVGLYLDRPRGFGEQEKRG